MTVIHILYSLAILLKLELSLTWGNRFDPPNVIKTFLFLFTFVLIILFSNKQNLGPIKYFGLF